jgi:hypothetical protein
MKHFPDGGPRRIEWIVVTTRVLALLALLLAQPALSQERGPRSDTSPFEVFLYIVLAFLVPTIIILVYFFPSMVASRRGNRNTKAIYVLNLFLGWTELGWIVALVWAFTEP